MRKLQFAHEVAYGLNASSSHLLPMNDRSFQGKLHAALAAKEGVDETGVSQDSQNGVKAIQDLIPSATIIGPTGPSFSSDILKLGERCELWLSIFGNLATTAGGQELDPLTMEKLRDALASVGWTFIPESVIAEPIGDDGGGHWFTELFDYY